MQGIKAKADGVNISRISLQKKNISIFWKPSKRKSISMTDPNKFIAKWVLMLFMIFCRLDWMNCHTTYVTKQGNETSQQRKNEALKRLQVVEAFRDAIKTVCATNLNG
jgi:DNA-directed RNA polymerase subunit beta'